MTKKFDFDEFKKLYERPTEEQELIFEIADDLDRMRSKIYKQLAKRKTPGHGTGP